MPTPEETPGQEREPATKDSFCVCNHRFSMHQGPKNLCQWHGCFCTNPRLKAEGETPAQGLTEGRLREALKRFVPEGFSCGKLKDHAKSCHIGSVTDPWCSCGADEARKLLALTPSKAEEQAKALMEFYRAYGGKYKYAPEHDIRKVDARNACEKAGL